MKANLSAKLVVLLACAAPACGGTTSPLDAGADGGTDAGVLDAGAVLDAGSVFDAGFVSDAGPEHDAGSDAGPDAGLDAGTDAGPLTWEFAERDYLCASAASPPCATETPTRTAEERTAVEPGELDGSERQYVVNVLSLPASSGDSAVGFNLDGIDSGSNPPGDGDCEHRAVDFLSSNEPGHVGVDNVFGTQLVTVIEAVADSDDCPEGGEGCIDRALARQLAAGELLLVFTLSGLDSLSFDAEVELNVSFGRAPEAGLQLDADGRIAAGQRFVRERDMGSVTGDVFDGRFRANLTHLSLPLDLFNTLLRLEVEDPEIRFDVSASGLDDIVVGGAVQTPDLVDWTLRWSGFDARAIFEGFADIGVGPTPEDPCTRISVALEMSAVGAL